MVSEAPAKIYQTGKKQKKHLLFMRKDLVEDSKFPFKPGEELIARIEGNKIILEKAPVESAKVKR